MRCREVVRLIPDNLIDRFFQIILIVIIVRCNEIVVFTGKLSVCEMEGNTGVFPVVPDIRWLLIMDYGTVNIKIKIIARHCRKTGRKCPCPVGTLPDEFRFRGIERINPTVKHEHIDTETGIYLRQLGNLSPGER